MYINSSLTLFDCSLELCSGLLPKPDKLRWYSFWEHLLGVTLESFATVIILRVGLFVIAL
jgi:hypothetical protein